MNDKQTDMIAIGNALVDILVQASDALLSEQHMQKGGMQLIDEDRMQHLLGLFDQRTERAGGSAANTAVAVANLGGKVGFIGQVGNDNLGRVFIEAMQDEQVQCFMSVPSEQLGKTGSCLVVVTPDSQRTMNTYLGIAPRIAADKIDQQAIEQTKLLYVEGYLWDQEITKQAIQQAMQYAQSANTEVAFTLSDPFCVDRHRYEFIDLIRTHVDLVFANEVEAMSLFECDQLDIAIEHFRQITDLAVITLSDKGSVIITQEEIIKIEAQQNLKVLDTTGAGDLYSGGFLYGYLLGKALKECGDIATICASEVIQHMGARPECDLKKIAL